LLHSLHKFFYVKLDESTIIIQGRLMSQLYKAELHVHLEGTIRPEMAKQLALRNQIEFPYHILDQTGQFYLSNDFLHFLGVYDMVAALIRHPRDYYDLTYDYLQQSALQGVIYTEMMYSPEHAEKVSGIPSIEHLLAIDEAIRQAELDFGIIGKIIITGVRHFGVESCEHVAQQALKYTVPSVVGFGLGGDEIHFPPELFAKAYAIASDGGLKCTIHAGEFGSAESMQVAIQTCKVSRIGHGVAAIKSPNTLAMLKDLNIALEVCPSSNVKLGLFPSIAQHPFQKLQQAGIAISINSDDPPFMNTNLGLEYQYVQQIFKYSDNDINAITLMALEHAFADEITKQTLKDKIIEI
jgi:adenosine deaminase